MELGIDPDKNLVYEGSGHWGHPIWPSPIALPAKFISPSADKIEPHPENLGPQSYVFREVSFDPVTRVRRGYLYHANSSTQPADWSVYPHPAIGQDNREMNRHGVVAKRLFSFGHFSLKVTMRDFDGELPLVVLGTTKSHTIWNILSFETDASNNELVALKSRLNFGALPNLDKSALPDKHSADIVSTISTLQNDIDMAGPVSVVDRCGETARLLLSAYCKDKGIAKPGLELGKLIRLLREQPKGEKREVIADLADAIRIFHTRGKSSAHENMDLRKITEQDAELAVQAVGVILCDLGWASW